MGQQRNSKLIRRKIRQETRLLHQTVQGLANVVLNHLQEHKAKEAPALPVMDQGLVTKDKDATVPETD